MAEGFNLTTYYAKRIIGDTAAANAEKALLQTGDDITTDTWILHRTDRTNKLYGIKYKYDSNGHDKMEYYGKASNDNATAWIQFDTGDASFNNILGKIYVTATSLPASNNIIYYLTYTDNATSGHQDIKNNNRLYIYEDTTSTYFNVGSSSTSGGITIHNANGNYSNIISSAFSADRTVTLPNEDGTFALMTNTDINALINLLGTGTSVLTADDYIITQYVGGGTTTTTYHRRMAKNVRVGGLTTARSIWGNSFDGTADISGNFIMKNTSSRFHRFTIKQHNTDNTVGEMYYDSGNVTNVTSGRWSWEEWSPNSTNNTSTTGFYEVYRLPTVDTGLTANASYDIRTSKSNNYTVAKANALANQGRATDANITHVADGGVKLYLATSSMTSNKPATDGYILHFNWDTSSAWNCQLYLSDNGWGMQYRGSTAANTWGSWKTIIDSTNWYKQIFANKNISRNTLTVYDSTWAVTSGTDVFGLSFKDTGLTYTPSGGSATASSDTGDWRAWLTCATDSNTVKLNMRIDGSFQSDVLYSSYIDASGAAQPTAGKLAGLTSAHSRLYGNALYISNPSTTNDQGWIRVLGTGETDTVLEIATGDDGGAGEQIVCRQYNTSNVVARQATLLDTSGNTSFPGQVSCVGRSTTDTTTANYYHTGGLQIYESNLVGNTQDNFAYAPRIGFHWRNRIAATLSFHKDGIFYFRKQNGTDRATIDAIISRAGVSKSWYQGRDSAIIKTTSYSGYDAILSMKTTAGDWALGVYNDNIMYFTYILDSNYNANSNTVTKQFIFNPNGTLTATTFSGALSGNATSATYLKDRTNSTASYLNYGAAGLAASAITWLCCWNGYEVRAISKAEMANAVDSAHKWVRIDGDTMTGDLLFSNSATATRQIRGVVGGNDYWRVAGGATAANAGWMEIATADDGNEPIYVRQYTGAYTTIKRTLTLLDASGDTIFPGSLYLNNRGTNIIYNGPNDAANGVGGALNNLVFSAWYGISFTTSCTGQTYTNTNAVSINCRNGNMYAARFNGPLTGNVTGNCSGSSGSCTGNSNTANYQNCVQTNEIRYARNGNMASANDLWQGWAFAEGKVAVINGWRFGNGNGALAPIYGSKVYNAIWNDFAEYRESDVFEGGRVLVSDGHGKLVLATERLQPAARVISDTFGCSVGQSDKAKTPIGVAGRVLVYPYQDRNNYKVGDCLCAAPNGTADIMTREEIINYPDRIIGIVDEVPTYEVWQQSLTNYKKKDNGEIDEIGEKNTTDTKVNGRIWIYVR